MRDRIAKLHASGTNVSGYRLNTRYPDGPGSRLAYTPIRLVGRLAAFHQIS